MSARLAALRPWLAPLSVSVAVHGALAAAAIGLGGLTEPPRVETPIAVELVFAAAAPATVPKTDESTPSVSHAMEPPQQHAPAPAVAGRAAAAAYAPEHRSMDAPASSSPPAPLPRRKPAPPPELMDALAASAADKLRPSRERIRPASDAAPAAPNAMPAPQRQAPQALAAVPAAGTPVPPTAHAPAAAALVPPGWGAPGLGNAAPRYPTAARRQGVEGRVVLRVRVAADGTAESVAVARSSGHGLLDEAARRAVERWRFSPGRLAGLAVAASVEVPVTFRLKE